MLVVTTPTLAGREFVDVLGMVRGAAILRGNVGENGTAVRIR